MVVTLVLLAELVQDAGVLGFGVVPVDQRPPALCGRGTGKQASGQGRGKHSQSDYFRLLADGQR